MTEVFRYKAVKMLTEGGSKISYDPHGPEVVMAEAYDQLKAENEALRKDAERYRAIRDDIPHLDLEGAILDVRTAAEYDSAVDATMTREASHG
jgi:hypothetical protein